MIIDLARFVKTEQPFWQELEAALQKLHNDPHRKMPVEELMHFHELYQRASADLARLDTFSAESELRVYLEALVSKAYGEMQDAPAGSRFRPWHWLSITLPVTFRRRAKAFQFSLLLTLVGALFGALALQIDPDAKAVIMPFSHLNGSPAERVHDEEAGRSKELDGRKGSFASYLMTHNTRVTITTMAFGMTFGIGTIVLLFYNGVILGAVAFDYISSGYLTFLLGWLLPHGSVEIPAILIGGQAGLVVAHALIGWGSRVTRRERMRVIAPDLVTLIGGAALLLIWAGIVEAFFSQYHAPVLPYSVKIAFGTVQLVLLCFYLKFAGRKGESS